MLPNVETKVSSGDPPPLSVAARNYHVPRNTTVVRYQDGIAGMLNFNKNSKLNTHHYATQSTRAEMYLT